MHIPRKECSRGLTDAEDTVGKAFLEDSGERHLRKEFKVEKHHMNTKGERSMKERYTGYRNNYMGMPVMTYGGGYKNNV